ncbi:hypothetical protein TYRP_016043 [Tyrophagus putrescentiae]|nr:hypothetical protein TYRP_016043 [Tyrophagus putrescentiae]
MSSASETATLPLYCSTFCATQLPDDCLYHLFNVYFSFQDVINLGQTCSQLNGRYRLYMQRLQCLQLLNDTDNPGYEWAKKMLRDKDGSLNQPVADNQTVFRLTSKTVNNFLNSFKASLFPQLTSLELTGQLSLTRFPRLVKQLNSLSQLTTLTLCISFEMESYQEDSLRPPALLHLTLAIVENPFSCLKNFEQNIAAKFPPNGFLLLSEQLHSFRLYTAMRLSILCELISHSVDLNPKLSVADGSLVIAVNTKNGPLGTTDNRALAYITAAEVFAFKTPGKESWPTFCSLNPWLHLPRLSTLQLIFFHEQEAKRTQETLTQMAVFIHSVMHQLSNASTSFAPVLRTLLIDLPNRLTWRQQTIEEGEWHQPLETMVLPISLLNQIKPLPSVTTVEIRGFSTAEHSNVLQNFFLDHFFPQLRRLKVHYVQNHCIQCTQMKVSSYQECARKLVSSLRFRLPTLYSSREKDGSRTVVRYNSLEDVLIDKKEVLTYQKEKTLNV